MRNSFKYLYRDVSTKKIHNLKFENHILFSRLSENFSWRYSHSALRECSEEGREEPEYRVFAEGEKKYIVKYQKITTNHKNRHLSGTNDFSGKMQVWAYWNYSFNIHLNYLGPVSCFSPSVIPFTVHHQGLLQWSMVLWLQHPVYWNG